MTSNIYLDLTRQFNTGRLRAILSSGQAVVMHGLAFASKDGDWIVREDEEALDFILEVLAKWGATYRLGAPLDVRWMSGGWSAHFDFQTDGYRARTDFVTRPPRLSTEDLAQMWGEQERGENDDLPVPTVDLRRLAHLKATDRERDYAFIGEIARKMESPEQQLLWSRSARELLELAAQFPLEAREMEEERPLLAQISRGREAVEVALDAERRALARINEDRLRAYSHAAKQWTQNWPALNRQIAVLPLREAHQILVSQAPTLLPQKVDF